MTSQILWTPKKKLFFKDVQKVFENTESLSATELQYLHDVYSFGLSVAYAITAIKAVRMEKEMRKLFHEEAKKIGKNKE